MRHDMHVNIVTFQPGASIPFVYRLKHPFRDGTTHVVLDPLDFMRHIPVSSLRQASAMSSSSPIASVGICATL